MADIKVDFWRYPVGQLPRKFEGKLSVSVIGLVAAFAIASLVYLYAGDRNDNDSSGAVSERDSKDSPVLIPSYSRPPLVYEDEVNPWIDFASESSMRYRANSDRPSILKASMNPPAIKNIISGGSYCLGLDVENIHKADMVLESIRSSCQCTVPSIESPEVLPVGDVLRSTVVVATKQGGPISTSVALTASIKQDSIVDAALARSQFEYQGTFEVIPKAHYSGTLASAFEKGMTWSVDTGNSKWEPLGNPIVSHLKIEQVRVTRLAHETAWQVAPVLSPDARLEDFREHEVILIGFVNQDDELSGYLGFVISFSDAGAEGDRPVIYRHFNDNDLGPGVRLLDLESSVSSLPAKLKVKCTENDSGQRVIFWPGYMN